MSEHDIEFLTAETHKLERAGIVLGSGGRDRFILSPCRTEQQGSCVNKQPPLHPHPRRGRKRVHASDYARLKAQRRRKSRMITK